MGDLPDNLPDALAALESRDVIGMAKGILMRAENVDPEGAFQVLIDLSQRENRKLRDVAADLVACYPLDGGDGGLAAQPRRRPALR